jgi:hypothetical protein
MARTRARMDEPDGIYPGLHHFQQKLIQLEAEKSLPAGMCGRGAQADGLQPRVLAVWRVLWYASF